MNILVSTKLKVLELIKWSYQFPPIMLIIEPRMVNKLWAWSPVSFKHMMSCLCPFLDPHPYHKPLKNVRLHLLSLFEDFFSESFLSNTSIFFRMHTKHQGSIGCT